METILFIVFCLLTLLSSIFIIDGVKNIFGKGWDNSSNLQQSEFLSSLCWFLSVVIAWFLMWDSLQIKF